MCRNVIPIADRLYSMKAVWPATCTSNRLAASLLVTLTSLALFATQSPPAFLNEIRGSCKIVSLWSHCG